MVIFTRFSHNLTKIVVFVNGEFLGQYNFLLLSLYLILFYSCVSNDNCLVDDIGGNQSEGFGSCYDLDAPTRNVEKTCCKTENVINKPQSCAVLADYNYRY